MKRKDFVTLVVAACAIAGSNTASVSPPVAPGLQPDGTVLLHNQWPIRPAGVQVPMDDLPVSLAIAPSGQFAAVLHAGYGPHNVTIIDLRTQVRIATVPVHEAFSGMAFSPDGRRLICGGGSDGVLHVFAFDRHALTPLPDITVAAGQAHAVVGGLALAPDGRTAFVTVLFASKIAAVDLTSGRSLWTTDLDLPPESAPAPKSAISDIAPNDSVIPRTLIIHSDPLGLAFDPGSQRLYASLWGCSDVAVLDARNGRILARWQVELHPNELLLSHVGSRLFVSNGGRNSVSALDTVSGQTIESLNSCFTPGGLPGSTPDSLCLSPDGRLLFAANADNNNIAVFDVSIPGKGRAIGFIPTGWFPTSVRMTPDGAQLLTLSGRGLGPASNARLSVRQLGSVPANSATGDGGSPIRTVQAGGGGSRQSFPYIGALYHGSLGIVDMPQGNDLDQALRRWTAVAESCHPAAVSPTAADSPVPSQRGAPSPLRYVIYIIKENRTYDQVFGDIREGNGDASLCLFPERTTPNLHRLVREFVLLDNFYANAEVSPSGHEWSTAAYASEFVERTWPINYGHKHSNVPYPAEGGFAAAIPALGYIWDRALAAGVSVRDYGEFVTGQATAEDPARSNLPALQGKVDPFYRGWDLHYSDLDRVRRFIVELHRFETAGDMPRLQVLRLPNDHTEAATAGALTPRAMVAQNDLAVGQLVEAISHSRFWPQTVIFIVEDDAQNGPDHVDAHRTEALVVSPYARRHAVDSTPYTTCSMLATIEHILNIEPMSQFDAAATPMRASFQAMADLGFYAAVPEQISLEERNPARTRAAAMSARLDFSREDAADEQIFNRIIWQSVRGEGSIMPAPVHAAFVRPIHAAHDDDD